MTMWIYWQALVLKKSSLTFTYRASPAKNPLNLKNNMVQGI